MERTLTFNTNFYSELYLYTTCSRDILCVRRRPSRLGRRIETGGAQVALLWHRFRGYSGHFPGLFFCTELWLWFDFAKVFFFIFLLDWCDGQPYVSTPVEMVWTNYCLAGIHFILAGNRSITHAMEQTVKVFSVSCTRLPFYGRKKRGEKKIDQLVLYLLGKRRNEPNKAFHYMTLTVIFLRFRCLSLSISFSLLFLLRLPPSSCRFVIDVTTLVSPNSGAGRPEKKSSANESCLRQRQLTP